MMTFAEMIAGIVLIVTAGLRVESYSEGIGAYYHEVSLREVCQRRVEKGWHPPGVELLCTYPCLAAAVTADPMQLGDFWLVDLPGCSFHVCHIVDCAGVHDLPALVARNEVIEIDGLTARA